MKLQENWFFEDVDFERQKYMVLSYMQDIDTHYKNRIIQPYLNELKSLYKDGKKVIAFMNAVHARNTKITGIDMNNKILIREDTLTMVEPFGTIYDILLFALPEFLARIKQGKEIELDLYNKEIPK